LLATWRIVLLFDAPYLEVRQLGISHVFQEKRLLAIGHENPGFAVNLWNRHRDTP